MASCLGEHERETAVTIGANVRFTGRVSLRGNVFGNRIQSEPQVIHTYCWGFDLILL